MSTNQRGLVIFLVMIVMAVFFCFLMPFVILPNAGVAMALPVVQMPGEVYIEGWPAENFEFTNTLMGTLLADLVVILLAVFAWRASKGWTNKIPGRFQSMIEVLAGGLYSLVKQFAGERPRVRTQLYPLVASIFLFLLVANWLELIPGVDSIGILHCAGGHGEQQAYPRADASLFPGDVYQLKNTQAMFSGYPADEADFHACEAVLHGHEGEAEVADVEGEEAAESQVVAFNIDDPEVVYTVQEGDTVESIAEEFAELGVSVESLLQDNDNLDVEVALTAGDEVVIGEFVGDDALDPDNNLFVVTPFVRAAATDLNLTLGLALISFFAIQYFGVASLGINYFQKFINVHALGNMGKNPMGAIDFGVGVFEIVSELSKIISLSFRLFGNIFAGQLLLFIMAFLVATLLPVIFYGLEIIVGMIQALVFAALTLVFSAQAIEGHHADVDEEH